MLKNITKNNQFPAIIISNKHFESDINFIPGEFLQ